MDPKQSDYLKKIHSSSQILLGDSLRLGQILVNLAINAVKFTEKGEVIISSSLLKQEKDRVLVGFSVKDSGIGMSEPQLENLFQLFHQVDTSITRRYGGTCPDWLVLKLHAKLKVSSRFLPLPSSW